MRFRFYPFLSLLALGCPAPTNPQMLWLAENGSEAMVRLADQQPDPF